jgi:hypothetical protein
MNATDAKAGIPLDILADGNVIIDCVMAGKPVPPEVIRRVEQRADEITNRLRREFGVLDVGGPAIRELRGELPIP